MCLKVIENGKHKDVHIREGEVSANISLHIYVSISTYVYMQVHVMWSPTLIKINLSSISRCSCFQLGSPIPHRGRPTLWDWWWRGDGF